MPPPHTSLLGDQITPDMQASIGLCCCVQDLIFGASSPRPQQSSPRALPDAPPAESPRQAQPAQPVTAQSPPPNLPSPLPLRSSGTHGPSYFILRHQVLSLMKATAGC